MNSNTLGSRIRTARRAAGLSLSQVADGALSRSFLSMIEHDARRPAPKLLLRIARRVNSTLAELLRWTDQPSYGPGLIRYAKHLNMQEQYGDAAEVLEAVLALAEPAGLMWAEASVRLGYALTMTLHFDLARRRLWEGLDAADRTGDLELRALARNYCAVYLVNRDHLERAREMLEEAQALLQRVRVRDKSLPGVILMHFGQIEWRQGQPLAAIPYYRGSLVVFERARDLLRQGMAWRLIGVAYNVGGRHAEAIEPLYRAADVFTRAGNSRHLIRVLQSIGIVKKALGDLPQARKYLMESLRLAEHHADDRTTANTLPELAKVALIEEQWDDAMDFATRAVSVATKVGDIEEAANAEYVKARVLAHRGQLAKAVASFQWVIDVFEARGMHKELAEACSHLGRLHMRMGEMELASAALARALDLRSSGAA